MARFEASAPDTAAVRNAFALARVYGWGKRSRSWRATLMLFAWRTRASVSSRLQGRTAQRVPCSFTGRSQQAAAVALEPGLGGTEMRARGLDETPETAGVILLLQVHQLVYQHVLADGGRHLY